MSRFEVRRLLTRSTKEKRIRIDVLIRHRRKTADATRKTASSVDGIEKGEKKKKFNRPSSAETQLPCRACFYTKAVFYAAKRKRVIERTVCFVFCVCFAFREAEPVRKETPAANRACFPFLIVLFWSHAVRVCFPFCVSFTFDRIPVVQLVADRGRTSFSFSFSSRH